MMVVALKGLTVELLGVRWSTGPDLWGPSQALHLAPSCEVLQPHKECLPQHPSIGDS